MGGIAKWSQFRRWVWAVWFMASVIGDQATRDTVIERLGKQIRELEGGVRALQEDGSLRIFSSGSAAMDRCLPGGGYRYGSLLEFVTDRGSPQGATSLALRIAMEACREGKYLVYFDPERQLYPPALKSLGVELDRLIVVRPTNHADLIWGIDQALRSPSVGAVVGSLDRLDDRAARRLQLGVEAGGGVGILLRSWVGSQAGGQSPVGVRGGLNWANVQWLVSPRSLHDQDASGTRWFRLVLRRCQGGAAGLDSEAGKSGRGRVGRQLLVGIGKDGRWLEWESTDSHLSRSQLAGSLQRDLDREGCHGQANHVRVAAELAGSTRFGRTLAG